MSDEHAPKPPKDPTKHFVSPGKPAAAPLNKFTEQIRRIIPEHQACKLGCRGQKCKYESSTNWRKDQMVIDGIFSHWITEDILATARPNMDQIKNCALIDNFKKNQIRSIFNLQQPGEHASCGRGLDPSGYSYDPQQFMDEGIFFYSYPFKDFGVANLSVVLDMVKVFSFAVSQGSVAVHCHAGLGRTGYLIACYLVYEYRMDADDAIHYIREKRPGAVQMSDQIDGIRAFADYLKPLRVIFPAVTQSAPHFNLSQYLWRQRQLVHGVEAKLLRFIPKILYVCGQRLLVLAEKPLVDTNKSVMKLFSGVDSVHTSQDSLRHSADKADAISYSSSVDEKERIEAELEQNAHLDVANESGMLPRREHGLFAASLENVTAKLPEKYSSKKVLAALASQEASSEVMEAVNQYEKQLNATDEKWAQLMAEEEPHILAFLIYDWLKQLKEPVIRAQDITVLLEQPPEPQSLKYLEKGPRAVIEFLLKVVVHLKPSPSSKEQLLQRFLSALTHQIVEPEAQTSERTGSAMSSGSELMRTNLRFMGQFFEMLTDFIQRQVEP